MENKCYIFGEDHSPNERTEIENKIRDLNDRIGIKYILSEELGSYEYYDISSMQQAINDEMYSISPRTLELGIELNIPVIGIDTWNDSVYLDDIKDSDGNCIDFSSSFKIREYIMYSKIREFMQYNGNIVVIVGDSHLRTISTKELGKESILSTKLNTDDYIIIRSRNREIE